MDSSCIFDKKDLKTAKNFMERFVFIGIFDIIKKMAYHIPVEYRKIPTAEPGEFAIIRSFADVSRKAFL